jgi:rhodanese-related sulfurtransferase/DNA-binding transcriptional ArsR family regulator
MDTRDFKDKVYNELARITKALSNPHRLEIIDFLAQGPASVEKISKQTHLTVANASQHLQALKQAKLTETSKKGNYVFYRLSNNMVYEVWKGLFALGVSQIAEVDKLIHDFRHSRQTLESVTCLELLDKAKNADIMILDVRPAEEYEAGHIAKAFSMPYEQLVQKLKDLPKDKEIVAYCRGPLCVMADEAVDLLKKQGFNARRLNEGFPEWKTLGLPVE